MNQYLDPWDDTAPRTPATRPGVVMWFKVYAGAMLVVYLLLALVGGVMLSVPEMVTQEANASPSSGPATSVGEVVMIGTIYLALGLILAVPFAVALFLRRGKAVWVFNLVLICLGMTSLCCLPATIPLLIFWIRQDTRDWYYG